MQLFGCYASGVQGNWNPNGNDAGKNADWEAGVRAFGKNVGHDVNSVNVFPCWGPMGDWPVNLRDILVQGIFKSGFGKNMAPIVGLKMFSQKQPGDHAPDGYQWNDEAAYTDVANGKYDDVWRGLVKALVGTPYAAIRFGDEYNGSFMEDFMGWPPKAGEFDRPAMWKKAFNRGASVMKKQASDLGIRVDIMLNPNLMVNCPDVPGNLPDLANLDIIAADFYNGFWGQGDVNDPAVRKACWENGPGGFGVKAYLDLLKSTGKAAYFAECGSGPSSNGPAHGIANDPVYWPYMADIARRVRAQGTAYYGVSVWDINPSDGGWKFSDGTQPQCLKDFRNNLSWLVGDDVFGKATPILTVPSAAPAPVTSSTFPDTFVAAWGPDKLTLMMSEDAYQGDAQFSVAIDGNPLGGTQTIKAVHGKSQSQPFSFTGNFGGTHTVSVTFLNDAWGGSSATDRNLYLNAATINGVAIAGAAFDIQSNVSKAFTFTKGK